MDIMFNTLIHPLIFKEDNIIFRNHNTFYTLENNEEIRYVLEAVQQETKINIETLAENLVHKFAMTFSDSKQVILDLVAVGVLTKYLEKDRYFTNHAFFSMYDNENKESYQKILNEATIAVLGLGGSTVLLQSLMQIGIQNIIGVDFDTIEMKNLNRQVLFKEADIGKLKVDALRERMKEINKDLNLTLINKKITSSADVEDLIAEADIVILAIDEPIIDSSLWVHEAAQKMQKPLMEMGVWGTSLTYMYCDYADPAVDFSYHDYLAGLTQTDELAVLYMDEIKGRIFPNYNTTISPATHVLGGIVSSEMMKILTRYEEPMDCDILTVNMSDWSIDKYRFNGEKI